MKSMLLLLPVLFISALPAFGSGLTLILAPATQTASPGGSVIFSGTLTDTDMDGSFLFLNDISVNFTPPAGSFLSVDPAGEPASSPNTFFTNTVPGDLIGDGVPGDDTYAGPLFQVYVAPDAPSGTYFGVFNILGGYTAPGADFDPLLSPAAEFEVLVAPEPAAAGLMLAGLAGLAIIKRWRSKTG
jgi:hypothetical protein